MTAPIPQPQPNVAHDLTLPWRNDDPYPDIILDSNGEEVASFSNNEDCFFAVAACNSYASLKAKVEGLEAALRDMVNTFQPFTMKPVGAPNSAARLGQEHQIEVHSRARSALQPKGTAERTVAHEDCLNCRCAPDERCAP